MKNKFLIFLILLFGLSLNAQVQTEHEKKIYTDEEGIVYINQDLPVYFKISNSPSNSSEKILLESHSSPQYVNPLYFSKEGLNTVYSPSAVDTTTLEVIYPKKNVYFQIYVDGTAPKTKVHNNSTPYIKSDTLFFGLNLKIKFDTYDKISGIQKTYYSIDGENFKEYKNEELTFEQEKEYILKFYSVDNVGNIEDVNEVKFTIDASKPMTNLKVNGDYIDNIVSGTASISLQPEDAFAGVSTTYYILDKNEKKVYSQPINAKYLSEGEHTITYYTTDNVFNEEEKKVYTFFVDKTAPIIIDEIQGDSFFANGKEYSSGRSKLKLTAIDNRAGVKEIYYSISGGEWILYDKPFYLPAQKGSIDIDFYAVDNVKNKTKSDVNNSLSKLTFNTYVDLVGPDLSYKFDGKTFKFDDTVYISNETKIILQGVDAESGMKYITYNLDNNSEVDYNGNLTVSGDGNHVIDFFGYDNVNNSNLSSFAFKVDETGPEIFTQFSVNSIGKKIINGVEYLIYPSHCKLYISAFDNMVGVENIYYSINGLTEKLYSSVFSSFIKGKSYNIKFRALDYLGNETTFQTNFYIAD